MYAVFEDGFAVFLRRTFGEEASLGASRHDDRVLDHLCFHQAEHLGTEIFAAIGPTQTATGNVATAQVHALDFGRIDEDLVFRSRSRHLRQPGRVQFD